uniref:Uncharacterized protein n=1 Tax=Globodera rostochiensis TaxID=31243 RepID=A0A914GVG6_GLORO
MERHQFMWFKIDDLALRFLLIGLALVFALLAALATCVICCWRRRKKQQQQHRRVRPRMQKVPRITVEEAFSGLPDPNVKAKNLFTIMDYSTTTTVASTEKSEKNNKLTHDSPLPPLNGVDYLDIGAPINVVILDGTEMQNQQNVHQICKNGGGQPENNNSATERNGTAAAAQKWSLKDRPFTILINDEEIGHKNQLLAADHQRNGQMAYKQQNGNILSVATPSPSPKRFVSKMAKVTENENEQIYGEFETLSQSALSTIRPRTTEAEMPENIRKNRFYDILPFEFNRVKLRWTSAYGGTDGKGDYINASHIRSKEHGPIQYIAAQGPISESESADGRRVATVRDFWEMIWQEGVDCIVMLTQCNEGGKQKCADYWPEAPGESETISSDLSVHLYCVTDDEICVQRELWMERKGHSRRKVQQWHFNEWPDATRPARIEVLLDFVQSIRASTKRAPMLVHCSAGVGRTGVFIALDMLLDKLQKEQILDVKETVAWLRTQRIAMVQSAEQYVTIYEAIAMAIRRKSRSTG